MWTYEQKTGRLIDATGTQVGRGYSGWDDGDGVPEPGEGKNDPKAEGKKNVGPIPRGRWHITHAPFHHPTAGPFVMRVCPIDVPNKYGRDSFMIHGDSLKLPGSASHGCIILSRDLREKVWNSGDHEILVVSGEVNAAQGGVA